MAKIELPPLVSEVDVSRVITAYKACKDGHCSECPYQENHWGCEDNLADDIVKYLTCLQNENAELRKRVEEQQKTIEKLAKYSAVLYAYGYFEERKNEE